MLVADGKHGEIVKMFAFFTVFKDVTAVDTLLGRCCTTDKDLTLACASSLPGQDGRRYGDQV